MKIPSTVVGTYLEEYERSCQRALAKGFRALAGAYREMAQLAPTPEERESALQEARWQEEKALACWRGDVE